MLRKQFSDGFECTPREISGVEVSDDVNDGSQVRLLGKAALHEHFQDRIGLTRHLSEVELPNYFILDRRRASSGLHKDAGSFGSAIVTWHLVYRPKGSGQGLQIIVKTCLQWADLLLIVRVAVLKIG